MPCRLVLATFTNFSDELGASGRDHEAKLGLEYTETTSMPALVSRHVGKAPDNELELATK